MVYYQITYETVEFLEYVGLRHPEWDIYYKPKHPSTQLMAKSIFRDNQDGPSIFLVGAQTAGRGRMDRTWQSSQEGKDITMTLLLPLSEEAENISLVNIIGGISVAEALTDLTNVKFKVKWPNDVFHGRSKISGICSELLIDDDRRSVALGIGINVNSKTEDFKDVQSFYKIDSVSSVVGSQIDLAKLIVEIIDRLVSNLSLVDYDMFVKLEKKWRLMAIESNAAIRYREIGGEWREAKAKGITREGYLMLIDKNGTALESLIEGDVVPLDD